MSFADVINLQITVSSKSPTQAGFGTPMILGYHTAWLDRLVHEYSDPSEMVTDGFPADHYLVKLADALVSQNPRPPTFKIGRRATALTQKIELTPTITRPGFIYSGSIDGTAFTYTNGNSESVASICTALETAIAAITSVTPVASSTKVTVTNNTPGDVRDFSIGVGLKINDATVDTTTGNELAAIDAEDDDWYGLIIADSQSKATITAGAVWEETVRKIFVAQTADDDVLDPNATTDIMSTLQASSYSRTGVIYHRKIGGVEWLAVGWLAQRLTSIPGSDTWAFKTIAGVSVDTAPFLSTAAMSSIKKKNGSYYSVTGGINWTFEGKVSDGEYFDTIRFVDWLYARIREQVVAVLANNKKIPYTNTGVDLMRSAILSVLKQGVVNGGLSDTPAPSVDAPRVEDVGTTNKANRILPNVTFKGTLAGAIHKLDPVIGTISV